MKPEETARNLIEAHNKLREKIRERWQRTLPFGEEIQDRWEKADFLGFGKGTSVYDSSYVYGDVTVGENTWIGPFTLLDGSGGLVIGSYCSVSAGVHIYTHDTVKWALSGGRAEYERSPVVIGDCCYIGPNAVISSGVKVGNRCVIGASSFVNRDVPDNTIVLGIPARKRGRVRVYDDGRVEFDYDD